MTMTIIIPMEQQDCLHIGIFANGTNWDKFKLVFKVEGGL